jgi:hypothetical protein
MHTDISTLVAWNLSKVIITKTCHESYHIAGIAVGNGFTDPINMLHYSDLVYQLGLVDTIFYNEIKTIEEAVKMAVLEGRPVDGFMVYTAIHNFITLYQPSVHPCQSGSSLQNN